MADVAQTKVADSPPDVAPTVVPTLPEFGIGHLKLWLYCSAGYAVPFALLGLMHLVLIDIPRMSFPRLLGLLALTVSQAGPIMIAGAAVAGMTTLVRERLRRGPPVFLHPGHWLLFCSFVAFAVGMVPMLLLLAIPGKQQLDLILMVSILCAFMLAGALCVVCLLAARRSTTRHWKVLFVALAVFSLIAKLTALALYSPSAAYMFRSVVERVRTIASSGIGLAAFVIVAVALYDLALGARRDWLHWAGIAIYCATIGANFGEILVIRQWF